MYTPYEICLGRKYRYLKQLNRPLVVLFNSSLCNKHLTEKVKISFVQLVIRLFYKDCLGFRINGFFQNYKECKLVNGDEILLICHATKAVVRKLLLRLNYVIDDYKLLKRRKYTLKFTFYIINNVIENIDKKITLDINCQPTDTFHFFITMGQKYYAKDLIQMLFFYYIEECGEIEHKLDSEFVV